MKPRILYVTHRVPFPPDRGDRIRTWNILKFLARHAEVDLLSFADEPVSRETRAVLQRVTRRHAIVPLRSRGRYLRGAVSMLRGRTVTEGMFDSGLAKSVIRQWGLTAQYSAALASSSGIARYVQQPILRAAGRIWVDLIDVDSQKWLDYSGSVSLPMSLVYGVEGRRLRKLETRLASEVERLLVVSEAERQLFLEFCPDAPVHSVGNGVDIEHFVPTGQSVQPHTCVFVGVLDYLPNSDAVTWFSLSVWPMIRQRFPDAEFRIVGRNPTASVRALAEIPGVNVVGPVEDVRPWLNSSTCAVVPLRIARGVQNKVLEAMACGRPVVCAPALLQGLDVESGLHLLRADSPEDWCEQIELVFNDQNRCEELGMAAGAWVELNHRWKACLEPLIELIHQPGSADRVRGFLNQPDQ